MTPTSAATCPPNGYLLSRIPFRRFSSFLIWTQRTRRRFESAHYRLFMCCCDCGVPLSGVIPTALPAAEQRSTYPAKPHRGPRVPDRNIVGDWGRTPLVFPDDRGDGHGPNTHHASIINSANLAQAEGEKLILNCCAARVAGDNLEIRDARPWAEPVHNPSERRDVPMSAAAVAPDWNPKTPLSPCPYPALLLGNNETNEGCSATILHPLQEIQSLLFFLFRFYPRLFGFARALLGRRIIEVVVFVLRIRPCLEAIDRRRHGHIGHLRRGGRCRPGRLRHMLLVVRHSVRHWGSGVRCRRRCPAGCVSRLLTREAIAI